jgi:hypothetical protein
MTPARHHAEWLSLVESSGPFLSMPVLLRVFPQGLDLRDSARAAALRENYEDWLDRGRPLLHVHTAWIRHVLESLLELPAEFIAEGQSIPAGLEANQPHFGETLRPDLVLRRPSGSTADADTTPQLLVVTYPPTQDLEKPVAGKVWKASPATRMTELLHVSGVPLGLVTNGEHWMVVYAPRGETSGFASWYADLWMQEPVTLRAFHSLLCLRRFFGVAPGETLAAIYAESAKDQQEVTDQLGRQVRHAVEMLVQDFDRIDAESDRTLLAHVPEKEVYDAALTVMMRLVFLFCAEERGLLLLGDDLYDQHYAVSTLRDLLRERADQHGEEVLERRHDAWSRLLATFRTVHGGVRHESMRLPAYGGSLFDPDRYPFLEGREPGTRWRESPAHPLAVNNRVVLHLLEALQLLRVKVPGGGPAEARRVSFRALDIEQIGHVYEGLLDHTARRAAEPMLGLDGKKEPEIQLAKLEELAGIAPATGEITLSDERKVADAPGSSVVDFPTRKVNYGKAPAALIDFLKESTGRTPNALQKSLDAFVDDHALLLACGQDPRLARRIRPFAGLLRQDDFGRHVVIRPGSVFVTQGSDRRSTGTHYTQKSLTEPIVKYTLDPLVYIGPAEGLPEAEWKLKSPREILALKVCDLAMGSGAFLVQACRYLAERLCEAWEIAEKEHAGSILITPDGEFSTGSSAERLLPLDPAERLAIARRYVADRCLYGVDINPMAVEMAKLSLWLITLQKDRPFTFVDHALKCGDSLLGISHVRQLERFSLRESDAAQPLLDTANLWRHIEEATRLRRDLEATPSDTPSQLDAKLRLHREAETQLAKLRAAADFLIAAELDCPTDRGWESRRALAASHMQAAWQKDPETFQQLARQELKSRRPFHWPLEFPEVFEEEKEGETAGFDAFVGNPPFIGNKYWKDRLPEGFQSWAERMIQSSVGKADLIALFLRRAFLHLNLSGKMGMIATTTAREGDTLEIGLGWISEAGDIYRAISQQEWPGAAGVHICIIWISRNQTTTTRILDEIPAEKIPPSLDPISISKSPLPLATEIWGFAGSDNSKGTSFIVNSTSEWFAILSKSESPYFRPYITGDDITSGTFDPPVRFAVDCEDADLEDVKESSPITEQFLRTAVLPNRTPNELKPYKGLADRWWQFWNHRAALYRRLRKHETCIAIPKVAKFVCLAEVPSSWIFTNKVCVIEKPSHEKHLALLSDFFSIWVIANGGTMGTSTITVTLETGIQTFPTPNSISLASLILGEWHSKWRYISRNIGPGHTAILNLLHDPGVTSPDIEELRLLRRQLDLAVAAAYGWDDLAANDGARLGHGFHETKQGIRYTLAPAARREVLDRLLALNHQRHAEEVAAGLHDKKKGKSKTATSKPATKRGRKAKAAAPATGVPVMPADFRFPAPTPQLYAVNLVTALLSARPEGLAWPVLRDAFAAATMPALMRRLAFPQDRMQIAAWAGRWNEQTTPDFLIPTLREMTGANIAVTGRGTDAVFSLQDGPREPATEDVAYDAWLALRVVEPLTSAALPDDEASVLDAEIEKLLASL